MFGFNRPYVRNNYDKFTPYYYPGEVYSFYFNSDVVLSDPDYNFFSLQLVDANNISIDNLVDRTSSSVQVLFIAGSYGYHLYKENFRIPMCKDGDYFIRVWNDNKQHEVCRSQPIRVDNSCLNKTTFVKFRHNDSLYGIRYDLLPNFYMKFRLPISQIKAVKIDSVREQYRESSNARLLRNSKSFRDILITLEMYWADDEDFGAISAMLEHTEIYIGGNKLIDMTQIVIEKPTELSKLSKGTFDVIVDDYNLDRRKIDNYGDFILCGGNTFTKDDNRVVTGLF